MGARRVSVADSAQARTPPSAGLTVPFIEPAFKWVKANRPATTMVVAISLSTVNSINVDLNVNNGSTYWGRVPLHGNQGLCHKRNVKNARGREGGEIVPQRAGQEG